MEQMSRFNKDERRLIFGMSLMTGIRTLGVSMMMSVFSYYAIHLHGATEQMVGVAIGIFGISQALFQIPMGRLSDRWGRKYITILGSMIFMLGTILCGLSRDVYTLAAARFIAGAGAVAGVTMTWITDGVNEQWRNSAVAYLGMFIGIAVILGFPLSWVITDIYGAAFVFYVCAFFLLIAIIYILLCLKEETIGRKLYNEEHAGIRKIMRELTGNRDLFRLCMIGFIGNVCLAGMFYIMPLLIVKEIHLNSMWQVFAPTAIVGTSIMFYFAKKADKQGSARIIYTGLGFELIGVIIPVTSHSIYFLAASLIIFYSGHCILSSTLPVAVSRHPKEGVKGTVMSIFTSFQFLGMGFGGIVSGFILRASSSYLFGFLIVLIISAHIIMIGYKDFGKIYRLSKKAYVSTGSPVKLNITDP
jgi:MFS family permease